jgi:hypothetical protein
MCFGTKLKFTGTCGFTPYSLTKSFINESLAQASRKDTMLFNKLGAPKTPIPCQIAAFSGEARAYKKNCGEDGVSLKL